MKRDTQKQLIAACHASSIYDVIDTLEDEFMNSSKGWKAGAEKFLEFIKDGRPRFSIFQMNGNKKLPFAKFSSAPEATCPGAGECLSFCYSFRAWRFVNPFFIHAQNTFLLQQETGRELIRAEFLKLPKGIEFRLYVDGDFDSLETLRFWMETIAMRPDIKVYGYSKSWELFLAHHDTGGKFPENYRLNISSGSKYGEAYRARMMTLPCVRGEFVAVVIPKKADAPIGARTPEYRKAVLASIGARAFVCPGLCGSCTPSGHACGSEKFKGVKIAIGVH